MRSSLLLLLAAAFPSAALLSPPTNLATLPTTTSSGSFRLHQSSTSTNNNDGNSAIQDNETQLPFSNKPSYDHYDSIVCGGGPAGLLTAIMLTQKYGPNHKIAVCEQRAAIPPSPSDPEVWNDVARFYLLGIGHRGQSALTKFGVFDDFVKASVQVDGRRDWQPGQTKVEEGRTTIANKDPPSRVLARDKLVGVLHEHLVENYAQNSNIDLLYGYQVEPLDFGTEADDKVSIRISKCEDIENLDESRASQDSSQLCDVDEVKTITTDFLIAADGAARTVARAMEDMEQVLYSKKNPLQKLFGSNPFRVTRFEDDNPRVYKSVPILLPPDWPRGLNYSARSKGSRITLEALPSDDKGNLCALLLMRPDDELAQPNVDPAKLRAFFDEEFPQFGALVDDEEMERIATKPASRLPVFRFAGPRLNMGHRTIVLGDAAHTVKPYYGLGANTALEDVQILSEILDASGNDVTKAVPAFSKRMAPDAAALVTISRNMDRPGKLFFVNFLMPLILDGIFHKMAPKIFGPNMFGMFQKKGMGFKQIQRKKRFDRTLQFAIIGSLLTGLGMALKTMVRLLAQTIGVRQGNIYLATTALALVAAQLKRAQAAKAKAETS